MGEDCFGKELDFDTRECQMCADNELCALLFQDTLGKKVKKFEQENGPTLDMADLSLIDKKGLEKLIQDKSGELTVEELSKKVIEQSNLHDSVAIVEWLKRFKEEIGFKVRGGKVYAK